MVTPSSNSISYSLRASIKIFSAPSTFLLSSVSSILRIITPPSVCHYYDKQSQTEFCIHIRSLFTATNSFVYSIWLSNSYYALSKIFCFKYYTKLHVWDKRADAKIVNNYFLQIEQVDQLNFSIGSLFVLGATICWGLENNCTRRISNKSTYQIVTIKELCSGFGSIIVALVSGKTNFALKYIPFALLLGFVSYGLSIFTYIRTQKYLGTAKTST